MSSSSTNENGYTVQEGQAKITFKSESEAFYNPVQEFNRDLSIAVIQLYLQQLAQEEKEKEKEKSKVVLLEALSATGLRSVRYAKEISGLDEIIANDISDKAVEAIKRNVKENEVEHLVTPSHNDASLAMYLRRKPSDRFTIVDLDPYGSPTPFLDAAVQSTKDGGLMCVTCTDMAVLCGNAPETCYTKYSSISLKSKCCHELGLRIVLRTIESHANRYGRYIEPLLSLNIDFYCRIFVRIRSGQKQCKESSSKLGDLYQCTGCESMTTRPLGKTTPHPDGRNIWYKLVTGPPVDRKCEFCANSHHIGGPFWLAPIQNEKFLAELVESLEREKFGTYDRMKGMLTVASEELHDVPFYYTQDRLCKLLGTSSCKLVNFRSALLNAGYRVSLSHANKLALKTDAPNSFIWDMMLAWEKLNPVNREKLSPDSVSAKLLARTQTREVSFELHPEANPESRKQQLKRFQINPERNWGPKPKAAAGTFADAEKRKRNQGKKRKYLETAEAVNENK